MHGVEDGENVMNGAKARIEDDLGRPLISSFARQQIVHMREPICHVCITI